MRVVSLVPSLTEAVAATAPGLLVGVTDRCTHPPGLVAARVGGSKNPDVPAVLTQRGARSSSPRSRPRRVSVPVTAQATTRNP